MKRSDYPPRPNLSKSQINRYGEDLRADGFKSKEALDAIDAWRVSHLYPLNTLRSILHKKTQTYGKAIIAQRLKRMRTIIEKLRRENSMSLARMEDIAGIRVVVKNLDQVYALDHYFCTKKEQYNIKIRHDYIERPKRDGYRSVHLVFSYQGRNETAHQYNGLQIELQIRTELEHVWATAVEVAGLMHGRRMKNGEGNKAWRDFFLYVSQALEIIEYLDSEGKHFKLPPDLQPVEVYKKIIELDRRHNIVKELEAYATLVQQASIRNFAYYIMIIDPTTRTLEIRGYDESEVEKANSDYIKLEEEHERSSIDQVFVSAGSMKQLKKAYPNYFLDVHKLVQYVRAIEEQIAKIGLPE